MTSTYFECDVPEDETDPRRFGYSRDRRSDCVQVVLALVVTMLPGNTADKTVDRGIPTEPSCGSSFTRRCGRTSRHGCGASAAS